MNVNVGVMWYYMNMARKIQFEVGEYYHVFNRGVDKRKVFMDKGDLFYFLDNLTILNREGIIINRDPKNGRSVEKKRAIKYGQLVHIVGYALLPNHFHLILKEVVPGGISRFMHKFGTSYTNFFNKKYDRSGSLFQGTFKATHAIDLVAMSTYVNLNYVHHKYNLKKDLVRTSYFEYIDPESVKELICNKTEIEYIIKISGGKKAYLSDARSWSDVFVESHLVNKAFDL